MHDGCGDGNNSRNILDQCYNKGRINSNGSKSSIMAIF
jgi:hypothetical protein